MTTTLTDLRDLFAEHQRMLKLSPLTVRGNYYNIRMFVRWLEEEKGIQTADQLQKIHLDAWVMKLNTHHTWHGLPIKPSAINVIIGSIRTFFKFLAERGFIMQPLAASLHYVKTPKLLPTSVLTHEEARKLLSRVEVGSPEGYRNRTMLELLYSSGLRAAEMLNMNVGDIDFNNATLVVTGKGNKQRNVPAGKTAMRFLETYIKAVRPYLVKAPNEPALFLHRDGTRFPYHVLRQLTLRYAEKAKLDVRVTAHTLRRSCATELLRGGANMYHVKDILGHETLTTMKHYAKLTITDLKKTHEQCHPRERDERG